MTRRAVRFFGFIFLAISLFGLTGRAGAAPVLVMDVSDGRVLYSQEAFDPWYPASLTKLMTAYLMFKAIRDGRTSLDARVANTPTAQAQPASKLGLPAAATLPMETALKSLIIKSANDVAVMLAEHISGSVDEFVIEMNRTARGLGMVGTLFVNPNGLPAAGQVSTARDMALLARAVILEFPEYNEIFGMPSFRLGQRNLRSYNSLLRTFEGADGMKTGFICASGYNIVASATRDGRRLIVVVLGAGSANQRAEIASTHLELGFQNAWVNPVAAASFSPQVSVERFMQIPRFSTLPEHMGPVVCSGRYRAGTDPYELDRRARQFVAMTIEVPLPDLRPGPLPSGMAVLSLGAVPMPLFRPGT